MLLSPINTDPKWQVLGKILPLICIQTCRGGAAVGSGSFTHGAVHPLMLFKFETVLQEAASIFDPKDEGALQPCILSPLWGNSSPRREEARTTHFN